MSVICELHRGRRGGGSDLHLEKMSCEGVSMIIEAKACCRWYMEAIHSSVVRNDDGGGSANS